MIAADARVWLDKAEGELSDARVLFNKYLETLDRGTAENVIELCQQALEKVLKALYMSQNINSPYPNRIHDLPKIASKCAFDPPMPKNLWTHLAHMSRLYLSARYPNCVTIEFLGDKARIKELFNLTEEAFRWISDQI